MSPKLGKSSNLSWIMCSQLRHCQTILFVVGLISIIFSVKISVLKSTPFAIASSIGILSHIIIKIFPFGRISISWWAMELSSLTVYSQVVLLFISIILPVPPKPPKSIVALLSLNNPIILPSDKISRSFPELVSKFHS